MLELPLAGINHVLRGNQWALDRLRAFASKTARLECPPASANVVVLANGELGIAPRSAVPDLTLRGTPGLMLRVLARDPAAWSGFEVSGDADFAAAIDYVWRNVQWDVEEDLSRIVGDVAAHRMVQTGRGVQRWAAQSAENLARSVTEYWVEEQPLLAGARDVEQFNRDVDRLRDDVERAAKRLEHLLRDPSGR
jgi:ubiquinone biosynthesis protein UbiJ